MKNYYDVILVNYNDKYLLRSNYSYAHMSIREIFFFIFLLNNNLQIL